MSRQFTSPAASGIVPLRPNPEAAVRLVSFPYAGRGISVFAGWLPKLPPAIELYGVQPPGRENRMREAPFLTMSPLVTSVTAALQAYLDKPMVFFGHSLGAMVAFEVARMLQTQHNYRLEHLFVAGSWAPHIPNPWPSIHVLPDASFVQAVQQLYGALPPDVVQDPELLALVLPILRADFTLAETYVYTPGPPLHCPITVFGGLEDRVIGFHDLAAWQEHSHQEITLRMFPGNHFFIHSVQEDVLWTIWHTLDLSAG